MKIIVTKDTVKIEEFDLVHEGEHKVNKCSFSFSAEYTKEFVRKAIFTSQNSSVEVAIINNECDIPTEILKARNIVLLGVYAYKVTEDKLDLRYSPSPDAFKVNSGSYSEGTNESEEITPSQFEQYMQALNDGLNKVEESLTKMDDAISSANDLVDDINQKLENGDFIGPEGPQGIPGNDGIGITTIISGQPTIEENKTITPVTVNKTDGSSQNFNVEAKNGIDGQNGKDGTNGQDGLTPTIGDNGNWYLGDIDTGKPSRGEVGPTPDLTDYVKNTDYATTDKTGVIKARNYFRVSTTGDTYVESMTKEAYKNTGDATFISKGTIENIKDDYVGSSTPVQDLNNNLDNLTPKNTASGEVVSVDDAIAYKTFNVTVDGASEQETTQGYNLCDGVNQNYYLNAEVNLSGIISGDTGLSIETNGVQNFTISTNSQQARYRVACTNVLPSGSGTLPVTVYNGVNKDGTSDNITINTNGYSYLIVNATDLSNIQIVEGTEAKPYEPYTGGPSPSPDYPQPITTLTFDKITRCGKNLYYGTSDNYSFTSNKASWYFVNGDNGANGKNVGNKTLYKGLVKEGETYTFKANVNGTIGNMTLIYDDESNIYGASTIWDEYTFTAKKDGYVLLRLWIPISNEIKISNVQLEPGTQATDYEPYQEQTYDIDLQGNEMVELPNRVKDELVIDKYGNVSLIKNVGKKILNGSEDWKDNWQNSTIPDHIQFYLSADFLNNNYIKTTSKNALANRFKAEGSVWIYSKEMLAINDDVKYTLQIKMLRSRVSDLASFKEWLSTHNVIVYYRLEEPQTIPLGTLSELITTLNGTNNISINGNIPTTISTTYALDIKKYIDNKLAEISTAMIEEG